MEDGALTVKITIPANTKATVNLPTDDPETVLEGEVKANRADGVDFKGMTTSGMARAVYHIGSGDYVFRAPWTAKS